MKKLKSNTEDKSLVLESGKTYKFAGYSWTACEVNNDRHVAVIQSHGVTHGAWPGFVMSQFGNGNYYSKSIDGQDISGYDNKMKELYVTIKDAENTSASYGKGLYLISEEEALEKAFPDGFSLQKDEHTFVVAGDEKGKFFVGLSDILQALAFAEDEADVPEIPQEWWEEIGKLYSA